MRCLIHGVPRSRFIWVNANRSLITGGSWWNFLNALGDLLLPDWLIIHGRLTWALVESRLLATFWGACCALMSQDHLASIAYMMSTLVLAHLGLLLEVGTIFSRNDLLTASQILNVSAWCAWLLPLLLDSRFLLLLTNGVLLRKMHVAIIGLVEGALRLHRIRAIRLLSQRHLRVLIAIGTRSHVRVLAPCKCVERCVTALIFCGLSYISRTRALIRGWSLDESLVIWASILLARDMNHVRDLHRLQLRQRALLRLRLILLIC